MHRERMTRGEDFKNIVRKGTRVGGQYVVTHAVLSSKAEKPKVGFIVSRRVGNAVKRNLIRRRLIGITNEIDEEIGTEVDLVFRAQPKAVNAKYADLKTEILQQIKKLRNKMMI